MYILLLATKIRGCLAEDIFKHYPDIILHDEALGEVLGKGCIGTKDKVGNLLDKCLVHDDVGLTGFGMEEFSHRRYQRVKKGFGGINMVEVQENGE